jgi:outer membrane biosynthesis protein TonB
MNSLWALALICISPVETYGKITIANRVPAGCSQVLGSPPLPTSLPAAVAPPIAEMAYQPTAEPVQAAPVKKAVKAPKKAKKPAKRARCKPGRTRNAKGVCGRWR